MTSKTIVVIPDIHVPDHHRKATANVFDMIGDLQPDHVHFLGDLYDMKPVARWSKNTIEENGRKLQREREEGDKFLGSFREKFDGYTTFSVGNHEQRLEKYLDLHAKGLFGLNFFDLGHFCHFDKYDIRIMEQPQVLAPGVVAIHGEKLGPTAGASAMKELRRHGKSIVQGHSHRLGIVYHTTDKRRFAAEFGWLGDIDKAEYLSFKGIADWSLGFGVLTVVDGQTYPELVPVLKNGSFVFRGEKYG